MSADLSLIDSFLVVSASKGYGFIARESSPNVFVHTSAIQSEGFRDLDEGQKVEFEVEQGNKSPRASDVTIQ